MIIPYEVDVPSDRRPFANWLLIGSIIVTFCLQFTTPPETWKIYILEGFSFRGIFGHMWLHGGLLHIIGNLIFLWIFGNAVCSKIGNIAYFPIYVVLGFFAAVAFLVLNEGAAIGASGAINGIVGMYLVFFPLNDISCLWILYGVGQFTLSSYWMIGLWFVYDISGLVRGGGGVAYSAHVGGFVAGVAIAVAMLLTGLIKMESCERSLLSLLGIKEGSGEGLFTRSDQGDDSQPHGPSDAAVAQILRERQLADQAVDELINQPVQKTVIVSPQPRAIDEFIRFQCPCGKRIKIGRAHAGKKGKCPACKDRIVIPTPAN